MTLFEYSIYECFDNRYEQYIDRVCLKRKPHTPYAMVYIKFCLFINKDYFIHTKQFYQYSNWKDVVVGIFVLL